MMDVIRCNMCGKELSVRNDILMEDAIIISKKWGYFSKKDGETHRICICEDCYDRQTALQYRYRETKRQNICRTRESFEYKMTLFSLQEKWFTDRVEIEVGG